MAKAAASVNVEAIERLTRQPLGNPDLYQEALRHGSLFRDSVIKDGAGTDLRSNERLEFLGDAVIDFITAERLFHRFPDEDEGFLTRVRARLVNKTALARFAAELGLGELLMMSEDMERTGGRTNQAILANAFEAVVGALYIDQGEAAVAEFLDRAMFGRIDLDDIAQRRDNYKSLLLEYAQARGWAQPHYKVVEMEGPAHDRKFTIEAMIDGKVLGTGTDRSKKLAEQQAAREGLVAIQSGGDDIESIVSDGSDADRGDVDAGVSNEDEPSSAR